MARRFKVYIDVGHGGKDPGAGANGLREKDITLTLAKKVESILREVATVKLSRTNDRYLTLTERANDANRWGADFFVSIHVNAGGGTGFESFVYTAASSESKRAQDVIHEEIMRWIDGEIDRGKKSANFAVVRQTKMPALLTENMFIDSDDANKLKDGAFLDKLAKGHAYGIAKAFGLGTPNEAPPKKATPKPSKPKAPAKPKPAPKKTTAKLTVDGKWGSATTRELQRALGTTADGIISSQPRNSVTQALYGGVTFGSKGSPMVRALQRKVGARVDGKLGAETVRKLQAYLGTVRDGKLSRPSLVVKEMQRRLNVGKF